MTEVKFCGMTRAADVREAASLGARYVGAIMTESPRRVTPDQARELFSVLADTAVKRVGVFGGEPISEIIDAARAAGVDVVQLHGQAYLDDPLIARLRSALGVHVWRVVRVGTGGLTDEQRHGPATDGLLLDTMTMGALGGTGMPFRWDFVASDVRALRSTTRVIVAGGLRPENVHEAIGLLAPDVVDVSSGVESEPGIKDQSRMAAFMNAVRQTMPASAP